MYYVACKETGDFIEKVNSISDGQKLIERYAIEDEYENAEDAFKFYDIVNEDHTSVLSGDVYSISGEGQTIADLYEDHSACELTIRDHDDNVILWYGEFEDMPIKYACVVFQKCTVNSYDAEIEVII